MSRDADPAHAADVAGRPARHLGDRDAAGGPPAGARPTWASTTRSSSSSAIEREHERDGQAFFLHNRVESIDETAERLRALCPGVRFAVAHGQMGEGELEKVMMDFLRGGADVLVCTSIIESGIDIPQANTLIVEHADALRPRPALPDPRPRRAQPRARLRLPALRLGRGADRRRPRSGSSALSRLHRARRRLQDRDARPRDPRRGQPARRRAVRPRRRARLRAVHADARRGGARGRAARPARSRPSRCASTSTSTPTSRPTTSPTSRPRSTCTAASRARARSPTWSCCATSSRTASGRVPEPLVEPARAAARAHQVRPGRARRP